MKKKHVVLGVTGSIAAYKAADIIRRLKDEGMRVSVIMTPGAQRFIPSLTLSTLSGEKAYSDMFDGEESWQIGHIKLSKEADVLLIAPATANIIAKLATGLSDDLLTCTALATKAPILVAPAMNQDMYNNKIVQENCRKLKKSGIRFIDPIQGKLACGTVGEGHLAEVEDIVKEVKSVLAT